MKQTNKLMLSLIIVATFVFVLGLVIAAPSINITTPQSSTTISGGAVAVNVTNISQFDQPLNCTFFLSSSFTGNSSDTEVGTGTNSTILAIINGTIDTTNVEDANNYVLNVSCRNQSNAISSTTNTGLTINNTIPAVATSLSPVANSKVTNGTFTISGIVQGPNVTACTVFYPKNKPGGLVSQVMTHTGNTCSVALTNIAEQTYDYIIQVTDGSDEFNTSSITIAFDGTTGATKSVTEAQAAEGRRVLAAGQIDGQIPRSAVFVGLAVVLVVVFLIFRKK